MAHSSRHLLRDQHLEHIAALHGRGNVAKIVFTAQEKGKRSSTETVDVGIGQDATAIMSTVAQRFVRITNVQVHAAGAG